MSASQNYKLAIARIGTRAIIKFHNEFSGAEFSVGARSGYPDLADCPKCLVSGPYDALVEEGAELLRGHALPADMAAYVRGLHAGREKPGKTGAHSPIRLGGVPFF